MLTGLEILIGRMKTNPEEFLHTSNVVPYEGEQFGGKWSDLLDYAWRVGDEEERKALHDAKTEFYRDDFNERVMKRLAGEEKQESPMEKFRIKTPHRTISNPIQNAAQMAQQQNVALQGSQYDPNTQG